MYIKIYFNDKPLFLCDQIDETIQPYVHHDDAIFIDQLDPHTIKTMIHEMQEPGVHAGVFLHADLDRLRKAFFKKFTLVKAGGGIVVNDKDEILLIFRRGKWDLPKGKLEKGESMADCALREVKEETGLKNVTINDLLTITYHTYHEGTHFVLKESHWYRMHADGNQLLFPQIEEQITEIKWVSRDDTGPFRAASYPSVAEVLGIFIESL